MPFFIDVRATGRTLALVGVGLNHAGDLRPRNGDSVHVSAGPLEDHLNDASVSTSSTHADVIGT